MDTPPNVFFVMARRFYEVTNSDTGKLIPCGLEQESKAFCRHLLRGDLSIVRRPNAGEMSFEYRGKRRKKTK
jgi:hypothetical protein